MEQSWTKPVELFSSLSVGTAKRNIDAARKSELLGCGVDASGFGD